MRNLIRGLAGTLVLAALPVVSEAGVFVSVSIAPPALPVYVLPEIPGPGYVWTPGYWAWGGDEYYWVPGTWVLAPVGLLWTPGYWGWGGGVYLWNAGYWGPHVGFYGGINYGFGYDGFGYRGGYWRGNEFVVNRTVINNVTVNRVSFNGGAGGLAARPTAGQMAATREHHEGPIPMQEQQRQMASRDRSMRASVNGGRPAIAATPRAGVFSGRGVVAARNSSRGSFRADRPMQSQDRARGNAPARNGFEPGRAGGNPQMRGGGVPQSRGGGVPQSRGGSEQGRGAFQPGRPGGEQPTRAPSRGNERQARPESQQHPDHQVRGGGPQYPERQVRSGVQMYPQRQFRSGGQPRQEPQVRGGGQPQQDRQARGAQDRREHGPG